MKPNGVIHYDFNFFGLTLPLQKLAFVPRFSSISMLVNSYPKRRRKKSLNMFERRFQKPLKLLRNTLKQLWRCVEALKRNTSKTKDPLELQYKKEALT